MLRYFYMLVCIQYCFCSDYTDTADLEYLERTIRKNDRVQKEVKHPKDRLVQFDVGEFIRRPDDAADDYEPYDYRNKRQENRRVTSDYGAHGSLIESNENVKESNDDYSNIDDNVAEPNARPALKKDSERHANYHLTKDDKDDGKSRHQENEMSVDREILNDPEKKCSYKSMKIPFFSYNKSKAKARRQKKRKIFCFNCHKTTNSQLGNNDNSKTEDVNKGHVKVSKRACGDLCPKCVKELLHNLKRKTTKKVKHGTTPTINDSKSITKESSTLLDKAETLENNLQDNYNVNVRKKRNEEEEIERDRRLKELEEVEKKIENVHVTAPTFTRVSMTVEN